MVLHSFVVDFDFKNLGNRMCCRRFAVKAPDDKAALHIAEQKLRRRLYHVSIVGGSIIRINGTNDIGTTSLDTKNV